MDGSLVVIGTSSVGDRSANGIGRTLNPGGPLFRFFSFLVSGESNGDGALAGVIDELPTRAGAFASAGRLVSEGSRTTGECGIACCSACCSEGPAGSVGVSCRPAGGCAASCGAMGCG